MTLNLFLPPEEINTAGKKKLRGVSCDVKNCLFNDQTGHCTAEKIAVGPTYATSCTDTVCATFRQRRS